MGRIPQLLGKCIAAAEKRGLEFLARPDDDEPVAFRDPFAQRGEGRVIRRTVGGDVVLRPV